MPSFTESNKFIFTFLIALLFVVYGCSTQKNTRATRAYHELTTRYNVFFNAQQTYDEILRQSYENYKDDWNSLLPIFTNSRDVNDTIEKKIGGPYSLVVEKTTKAIQDHSISVKPKKDRQKVNSQSYRDWLRQNEFNPFIDQAWLLMGKAHVQNGDYIEAIAVLSNTIRLFNYDIDVVSEAQIWLVRAYAELEWYSDAEVVVDGLLSRSIPNYLNPDFVSSYAFLLLKQQKYDLAIPLLKEAASKEKNNIQKRRLQYLTGQLYFITGDDNNAYDSFDKIKGIGTPNEISVNAVVAQSKVSVDRRNILDELVGLSKRAKNREHLDKIFCAIGDYYLMRSDTLQAMNSYLHAESKSVHHGIDKAIAQAKLGDLYFIQKQYVYSANKYSNAIHKLPKDYLNYSIVEKRTEVLNELSPHIKLISEQDSIQNLARLPYKEQLEIIKSHIAIIKRQESISNQPIVDLSTENFMSQLGGASLEAFYFYNSQQVSLGRDEFRRKWGARKLEDNWRISNKLGVGSDFIDKDNIDDEINLDNKIDNSDLNFSLDRFSPEFYLQQLPTTEEDILKSNNIILANLIEVGNIAKNRLLDFDLAIDSYLRIINDFGDSPIVEDAIYALYMISLQKGNYDESEKYKDIIISDYQGGKYADVLSDLEYETIMSDFAQSEESCYQDAYQAYQNGDPKLVQQNYNKAIRFFSNGRFLSKFKLLNALSYAQQGDEDILRSYLEDLINVFPGGDEAFIAKNIIDGLNEEKNLVANASVLTDMNWGKSSDIPLSQLSDEEFITQFDMDREQPHSLVLLFNDRNQKRSQLLFALSNHNFSNYQLRHFSTTFSKIGARNALVVKYFNSYREAEIYSDRIGDDDEFKNSISDSIETIIVSDSNYNLIFSDESLAQYKVLNMSAVRIIVNIADSDDLEESVDMPEELPETIIKIEKTDILHKVVVRDELGLEDRKIELERREHEALSQESGVMSDKERKKLIKIREQELKLRVKERDKELKTRERERKQKIKEQEEIRKAKLKERNRLLREKNR